MISEFNNERYRVCLDEHQDTEGECYAYGIELAVTDGEGGKGFGVDTIEFAQTKEEDLESSSHIEIIELHYFNELEEAKKCFKKFVPSSSYCLTGVAERPSFASNVSFKS